SRRFGSTQFLRVRPESGGDVITPPAVAASGAKKNAGLDCDALTHPGSPPPLQTTRNALQALSACSCSQSEIHAVCGYPGNQLSLSARALLIVARSFLPQMSRQMAIAVLCTAFVFEQITRTVCSLRVPHMLSLLQSWQR